MKFLEDLAARQRFGMKPGLDSIQAVSVALGNPHVFVPAIHVAGTNGKGAVCAILDAALRANGLRIGRYTSPHLIRLNERFFLDGSPVNDQTLDRLAEKVKAVAPDELTFFEALTAAAFLLYAVANVDFAIMECGLGGRFDATNICFSRLSVITRIGLDHCAWLGKTVEKIAAEKAGIIKAGMPVVLGANDPSIRAVVQARAEEVGAPFYYAPEIAKESEIPENFSLAGAFNRENAVTALAALKVLARTMADTPLAPKFRKVRFPLTVVWPGRFQRVGDVIVDGAHNPPAARALADALAGLGVAPHSLALVAGFCGDKEVDEVLTLLAPFVRKGYAVRTNNPRSLAAEETCARMNACGCEAVACSSLAAALAAAKEDACSADVSGDRPRADDRGDRPRVLVCGSLFLAGEALVTLGAYPWPADRVDLSEALSPTDK